MKHTELTGTIPFRGIRENATSCLEMLKASESKRKKIQIYLIVMYIGYIKMNKFNRIFAVVDFLGGFLMFLECHSKPEAAYTN